MITNTTYRVLVEKLGDSNSADFIGNEGEVFYDPSSPQIYLSDGSTQGGIVIGGGGGVDSGWTPTVSDTHTTKQVIIGQNSTSFTEDLVVEGNARITGILSVGTATIVLDPSQNTIAIGTAITLNADLNTIEIGGSVIGDSSGSANYVGVVTASSLVIGEEPVSETDIDNWNTAYGWGDHSTAGYLTSFTETDPVFSASDAAGITSTDISNWNSAYGWGDHSIQGYQTATSTSYSQTVFVDPDGDDITGNGGPNAPFQTLQAAHDHAEANIPLSDQVVVRLNCGSYGGNLLVTRPNIHFVGPTQGVSKSTRISGIVTVSTASSVGGAASDMISFENLLIAGSGNSVVTIGGTFGCSVMFKDAYVFTSSSTAKCVDVTNTAPGGVGVHMKNTQLQNQSSSGTTLDLSNTYYANLDLVTLFSGTGTSMNITTTDAVVYNTRIEKTGIGTAILANSSFTAGKPSLVLGNATIVNPTAADNPDGIFVSASSTVNIAQVAFNIAGTGFAVKGSAGSVVVNGNNLFVPGTTNKISTAITRVPLTTTFTAA